MRTKNDTTSRSSIGRKPLPLRLALRATRSKRGANDPATAERDRARVEIAKAMAALLSLWLNEPGERARARFRAEFDKLALRQTALMAIELEVALDRPEVDAALEVLRANNAALEREVEAMGKTVNALAKAAAILKLADKAIKLLGRLAML